MPYDPSTPAGQVRLLCQDTDSSIFTDNEITAFLNLNSSVVKLAAAQALDVIAASEVYVQKRIKSLDLFTDGPAEADALGKLAMELRRQVAEGDGDMTGFFDYAEGVYNQFNLRERMAKQWLRTDT